MFCSPTSTAISLEAEEISSTMLKRFVHEISFWGELDTVPENGDGNKTSREGTTSSRNRSRQQQRSVVTVTMDAKSKSQNSTLEKPASMTNNKKNGRNKGSSSSQGSRGDSSASSSNGPMWRTAVDPQTGRTYYYDAVTRKTQWEKPAEVRAKEKRERAERKSRDRRFFKEMEANIIRSLQRGQVLPGNDRVTREHLLSADSIEEVLTDDGPRVRTISTMEQSLLQQLKPIVPPVKPSSTSRQVRDAHGRPPLPRPSGKNLTQQMSSLSMELSPEVDTKSPEGKDDKLMGEALVDDADSELKSTNPAKPAVLNNHLRRNTEGTVFVKSTMTNPNIDATIKCVCGVYRAHIEQGLHQRNNRSPVSVLSSSYEAQAQQERLKELAEVFSDSKSFSSSKIPSLEQIVGFYTEFYRRAQMEHDTIIMSLIYVERLMKETNGIVSPRPGNWMSILFSCMVLASKVWDDLSMWNIDFSNVCGRNRVKSFRVFTLRRINQLELAVLKSLNFNVKVPASEYAKYYFLTRTMLMKSGLLHDDKNVPAPPASSESRGPSSDLDKPLSRRTKSMDYQAWHNREERRQPVPGVCLEQLMGR